MDAKTKLELQKTALKIRMGVLEGVFHAKSGHPGGSLSSSDIMAYLYFKQMRVDPKNPKDPDRDRFVLSKGHCAPVLYSALAHRGYFPVEDLKTLRQIGSYLQGHPDMKGTPGVDMSSGSLGQGISAACGMAKGAMIQGKNFHVYALLGDGELEEGQVWEAAMLAGHYQLDNLTAVVDYNGFQIDGKLSDVCSPEPIAPKFKAFNWNVIEICAHDFDEIEDAFQKALKHKGEPSVIVAHSVKGKCVSFMENLAKWHGTAPNAEQYERAMGELKTQLAAL